MAPTTRTFGSYPPIGYQTSRGLLEKSTSHFKLFQKTPGRLVPDGWVGPKSSGCRCHFRAFQLKLFILDIQNFGNGPVVKKLQLFEDAKFSKIPKNHRFYLGDSPSTLGPTVVSRWNSMIYNYALPCFKDTLHE